MNIVIKLMAMLAELFIDDNTFVRIKACVERWNEQEISGAEKHTGVYKELRLLGIELSTSVMNLLIELAVQTLKLNK